MLISFASLLDKDIAVLDRASQTPTCSEWAVNIQRDSYASYVGHYPILAYFAIAENESIGRRRYNFMQVEGEGMGS
ncbi:hypothetical protein SO802_026781 [Lithocarpus litseifolius]|uniref:Uncharacterized protein n=1 Tax=Lithocarpus litseifolius TaxID=425828 RepID=A0AAW2C2C5_9ROSI